MWRRIAVYLGFAEPEDEGERTTGASLLRAELLTSGLGMLVAASVAAVAAVTLLDVSPGRVLAGAGAGLLLVPRHPHRGR